MATTGDEKFQLIIRCAMQSFSDYTVECPAEWSILQLKEHLSQVCHMKPEVSRQRLIYAGHCLVNDQKVRDVLAQRRDGIQRNEPADKQVIHMVYIGQTLPAPRNTSGEGLRHRGTASSTNNTHQMRPDLSSSQNQQQFPQMFLPQQQQYNFANFQATPVNQQQQQSYEAWMAAYQNYMNQMQQFYQQMPYAPGPIHHPAQQAFGFMGTPQMPMMQQPGHRVIINGHQLVIPAQQHRPPNQENAVEGRMAMGGAGLQQAMPDLLDIVYKSIRFALLAMVLYLYSSLERFIFVLAIVALFWFVHRRRDQQREQNEQQPQGQQEEEGAEPAQNQQPDEPVPDAANGPQPVNNNTPAVAPSAWNVFFTVVQSFFTSLVPNPAPVPLDIN